MRLNGQHLSEDGIVLPIIAINRHTGRTETLPEIVSRGFAVRPFHCQTTGTP
jgi:ribonuclease J